MNNDINRIKEMKRDFIDAMIGYGVQYETCGKISAALNAAIESLATSSTPPVLAAPANSAVLPELPEHSILYTGVTLYSVEALRAYGQACAAAERAAIAENYERQAADYINDHGDYEPETGALVWEFGDAGRDYHSMLLEMAEEIRART